MSLKILEHQAPKQKLDKYLLQIFVLEQMVEVLGKLKFNDEFLLTILQRTELANHLHPQLILRQSSLYLFEISHTGVYYLSYLIFLHFLFLLFVKVLIMVFFDFPHIGPPFLGGLSQPMQDLAVLHYYFNFVKSLSVQRIPYNIRIQIKKARINRKK